MHYFRARWAAKTLVQFRDLVATFYMTTPPDGAMYGRINQMLPTVAWLAEELRVSTVFTAGSGAAGMRQLDGLSVIAEHQSGLWTVPRHALLGLLQRLVGAAEKEKRRSLWRLVNPAFLIIDGLGFVLSVPFLIMRAAGLPARYEDTAFEAVVKVATLVLIIVIALHFGLKSDLSDLLTFMK